MPETPRDEFAIAIAGPLASFGIAALGAAIAGLFGQSLLPVDLYGGPILHKVVWFNLIVGAFNLLPAFPLDGGRVLRSLLERRFDLERAIWGYKPGEKVSLKVRRGSKEMTLALKLTAGTDAANIASNRGTRGSATSHTRATGSAEQDSH